MDFAVALVADGDHVFGYVEAAPRWIAQMVRLGGWVLVAAFALAGGADEDLGAYFEKPWVP
jgi:hypothetical protein